MTDKERAAAVKRIQAKRGFWWNLAAYVIVNTALVIIWAVTWTGYFWPIWPMIGWGIGLAFHGWAVYGSHKISEERIQKEIEKGGNQP